MLKERLVVMTRNASDTSGSYFHGDSSNPLELVSYIFSAERMGARRISATLMCDVCLDGEWTGKEYVEFKGERYYLLSTPSSSKGNDDARYVHTCEFENERDLLLSNVYYCDAVSPSASSADRYQSNNTNVVFNGTLSEFVQRYNDVLSYRQLSGRFSVEVEQGLAASEIKLAAFENATLFEALVKAYETWGVPFYFNGNKAIFGNNDAGLLSGTFAYGSDERLLKVSKNNDGAQIVTRCTGEGSSDNIPYYYPNPTPKGTLGIEMVSGNVSLRDGDLSIVSQKTFASKIKDGVDVTFATPPTLSNAKLATSVTSPAAYTFGNNCNISGVFRYEKSGNYGARRLEYITLTFHLLSAVNTTANILLRANVVGTPESTPSANYINSNGKLKEGFLAITEVSTSSSSARISAEPKNVKITRRFKGHYNAAISNISEEVSIYDGQDININVDLSANIESVIYVKFAVRQMCAITSESGTMFTNANIASSAVINIANATATEQSYWYCNGYPYSLSELGLSLRQGASPSNGDKFKQAIVSSITPCANLMPSIYRSSGGSERFYNAMNNTYIKSGSYRAFTHVYDASLPREYVIPDKFDDIKPTIKGIKNASNALIGIIEDVYYEPGFNPVKVIEGTEDERRFPFFFVKLRRTDGQHSFNLFDCAIDEDAMSIKMVNGKCGSCEFVISVTTEGKNWVKVDANGNLLKDASGIVDKTGSDIQAVQQDTSAASVWIALKPDETSYGGGGNGTMPSHQQSWRVASGDEFVILHIQLPDSYITAAEDRLKEAILDFMEDNNDEKWSFSNDFSRVFLAQNPLIRDAINERSCLNIRYNGNTIGPLYVSEYTYRAEEGVPLPEISVELSDIVEIKTSGIERKIDSAAQRVITKVTIQNQARDEEQSESYVRKDLDETIRGLLTMLSGMNLGEGGDSGRIYIDEAGNSRAEVDYLKVRKKVEYSDAEIARMQSIAGKVIISSAHGKITDVEIVNINGTEYYRCYLDLNSGDGSESATNPFAANDLVFCETLDNQQKRYWRKVVSVGSGYIDISTSSSDMESGSALPEKGDLISQLGNIDNTSRQSAILVSAQGEDSPSLIMFNGINSFTLSNKDIIGMAYDSTSGSPKLYCFGPMFFGDRNLQDGFITYQNGALTVSGKIVMNSESEGLSNLSEFSTVATQANTAVTEAARANSGVDALDYLKTALTSIVGGLILTNLIALRDANNNITAGINGITSASLLGNGIAAWFGGEMREKSAAQQGQSYAKSLFRFDGTGYLADGLIKWEYDNGQVKLTLNNDIIVGSGSKTISNIVDSSNFFESVSDGQGHNYIRVKSPYTGLVAGFLSAGGLNDAQGQGTLMAVKIDGVTTFVTITDGVANLNLTGYLASKSLGMTKIVSTGASNTPRGVTWTSGGVTITGTLAAANADQNAIYLVPNSNSGNNTHDEYIVANNAWEIIGSTQIDLSGYMQKSEIGNYALTPSNYGGTLNSKYLSKTGNDALGGNLDVGNFILNFSGGSAWIRYQNGALILGSLPSVDIKLIPGNNKKAYYRDYEIATLNDLIGKIKAFTSRSEVTTPVTDSNWRFDSCLLYNTPGIFPTGNNANAMLSIDRLYGEDGQYNTQIGFNDAGDVYIRSFNGEVPNAAKAWYKIWHSGNLNTWLTDLYCRNIHISDSILLHAGENDDLAVLQRDAYHLLIGYGVPDKDANTYIHGKQIILRTGNRNEAVRLGESVATFILNSDFVNGTDIRKKMYLYEGTDIRNLYLPIHPERGGETNVLPFFSNDLAFIVEKGGTVEMYTTDAVESAYTQNSKLHDSNEFTTDIWNLDSLFDGSSEYCGYGVPTSDTKVVIDIKCPSGMSFGAGTMFYIDFGNTSWKSSDITVLKGSGNGNYAVSHKWCLNHSSSDSTPNDLSFVKFYEDLNPNSFDKIRVILSHGGYQNGKTITTSQNVTYNRRIDKDVSIVENSINVRYYAWSDANYDYVFTKVDGSDVQGTRVYTESGGAMVQSNITVSSTVLGDIRARIAEIGCIGFNSKLGRNTFMSLGCDDPVYRNVSPGKDEQYSIGNSTKKWKDAFVKRWYPTSDTTKYVEYDTANDAFKINGNIYATGTITAGGANANEGYAIQTKSENFNIPHVGSADVYICTASLTITLPSSPNVGMHFKLATRASGIILDGNGNDVMEYGNSLFIGSSISLYNSNCNCYEVFFDGTYWNVIRVVK